MLYQFQGMIAPSTRRLKTSGRFSCLLFKQLVLFIFLIFTLLVSIKQGISLRASVRQWELGYVFMSRQNVSNTIDGTASAVRSAASRQNYNEIKKPSLSRYIDMETRSIKSENVQELLDFVIAGFPKTGTTFLMRSWLGAHPETCMYVSESRS